MEKRAEWPALGRAAVSPFPGDILPSRTVYLCNLLLDSPKMSCLTCLHLLWYPQTPQYKIPQAQFPQIQLPQIQSQQNLPPQIASGISNLVNSAFDLVQQGRNSVRAIVQTAKNSKNRRRLLLILRGNYVRARKSIATALNPAPGPPVPLLHPWLPEGHG